MRTQFKPCIIFSVEKSTLSFQANAHNRAMAENDMKNMGIHFEKVLGVYQGSEEFSYIVTDMSKVQLILGMAKVYDQDSVLLRDNENRCHLKFFDGRSPEYIGFMRQVTQEEALKSDAYTYSPSLNNYFKCVV